MSRAANRAGTEPRANITDPDVRVMRNQKGYVAGYNGQACGHHQTRSLWRDAVPAPVDRTLLHPVLDTCRQQLTPGQHPPELRTVLANAGYVSEENFARADQDKLRLLAPLAKDPGPRGERPQKGSSTWTSIRPPPAPSGGCDIPADRRTTGCGPAPWNRCSGS